MERKLKKMKRNHEDLRGDAAHLYNCYKNELFRGAVDWVAAMGPKELAAHFDKWRSAMHPTVE